MKSFRKSQLEALECRRLLAVTTSQSGDTLTITGDAANDNISLVEAAGILAVTGNAGTTVNGGVVSTFAAGQYKTILIQLGDGADTLTIDGLTAANVDSVAISMGALDGSDTTSEQVHVGGAAAVAITDSLMISTGNGNDTIVVDNLSAASLTVLAFNAPVGDSVTVGANGSVSLSGGMSINSDSGADQVSVDQTTVMDDVVIGTGAGSDSIKIGAVNASNISIAAGDAGSTGSDMVQVGSASKAADVQNYLSISNGGGSGVVTVDNVFVGRSVNIDTDAPHSSSIADGADSVTVGGAAFEPDSGDLSIATGDGADSITMGDIWASTLDIDAGDCASGADMIVVGNASNTATVSAGAQILQGDGNALITLDNLTALAVKISAAGGNNDVFLGLASQISVYGAVDIATGAGGDQVTVDNLLALGNLSINTGDGQNLIAIGQSNAVSTAGTLGLFSGVSGARFILGKAYFVGPISVNASGGDNVIDMEGSSALGLISVTVGGGNDIVTVNQVSAAAELSIGMGDGNNTLKFSNSSAVAFASVGAGSGSDNITMSAVFFNKDFAMNDGDGDNTVTSSGTIFGPNASFITGNGADNFQLNNDVVKTISISTGDGTDKISLVGNLVDSIFAALGAGKDNLTANANQFNFGGLLDGGSGTDTLTLTNGTGETPSNVNFEVRNN